MQDKFKVSIENNLAILERTVYPRLVVVLDCSKPIFEIVSCKLLDECGSQEVHNAIDDITEFIRNMQESQE
jgi:hypothetical protein